MFQGCFKDVSWGFQRDFRAVLRVFNGTFKGEGQSKYVWRKFQEVSGAFFGCFKKYLRLFQECIQNVSRKLQRSFNQVSRAVQEGLK